MKNIRYVGGPFDQHIRAVDTLENEFRLQPPGVRTAAPLTVIYEATGARDDTGSVIYQYTGWE